MKSCQAKVSNLMKKYCDIWEYILFEVYKYQYFGKMVHTKPAEK